MDATVVNAPFEAGNVIQLKNTGALYLLYEYPLSSGAHNLKYTEITDELSIMDAHNQNEFANSRPTNFNVLCLKGEAGTKRLVLQDLVEKMRPDLSTLRSTRSKKDA
jgi:hypothetical protein